MRKCILLWCCIRRLDCRPIVHNLKMAPCQQELFVWGAGVWQGGLIKLLLRHPTPTDSFVLISVRFPAINDSLVKETITCKHDHPYKQNILYVAQRFTQIVCLWFPQKNQFIGGSLFDHSGISHPIPKHRIATKMWRQKNNNAFSKIGFSYCAAVVLCRCADEQCRVPSTDVDTWYKANPPSMHVIPISMVHSRLCLWHPSNSFGDSCLSRRQLYRNSRTHATRCLFRRS